MFEDIFAKNGWKNCTRRSWGFICKILWKAWNFECLTIYLKELWKMLKYEKIGSICKIYKKCENIKTPEFIYKI